MWFLFCTFNMTNKNKAISLIDSATIEIQLCSKFPYKI